MARLASREHAISTSGAAADETARLSVSTVWFRETTATERRTYCATGEPLDKAGAYGIQGLAAVFIARLEGSYSGVMGLPLYETAETLARIRFPVL